MFKFVPADPVSLSAPVDFPGPRRLPRFLLRPTSSSPASTASSCASSAESSTTTRATADASGSSSRRPTPAPPEPPGAAPARFNLQAEADSTPAPPEPPGAARFDSTPARLEPPGARSINLQAPPLLRSPPAPSDFARPCFDLQITLIQSGRFFPSWLADSVWPIPWSDLP
jgi:hypothetical protein